MQEGPGEVGGKPVSTRSGRGVSLRRSQEKGVQQGRGGEAISDLAESGFCDGGPGGSRSCYRRRAGG